MSNDKTTVIRGLDWLVAWDAAAGTHVYLRNADLAFRGDEVVHVGPGYAGPADTTISGAGRMASPGLVNVHSHPTSEPGNKGALEELGSPALGQSSLYEYMPVFRMDASAAPLASKVAIWELLKSGVTTFCDLSGAREGWADELAATGIRAVLCPMFRAATWSTRNGHVVDYAWDEAAGEKGLRHALEVIDSAGRHVSGRVSGMMGPSQIDTCSAGLLQESLAEARKRRIPTQLHAAQSIVEFNEITRRHGKTPIEWLDSIGLLGPDLIIGHGIFLNDHPQLHWPHADDFARLARSGAQVAHCPTVFARRGIALNTLGRYMDAGITCGIGTDTFPHNMLDELRLAAYAARVLTGNFKATSTAHVYAAATVGGARMLRRPDLGRLAPGAKADFFLADTDHPAMRPLRDPLRSLVYSAGDRAVRDVYVAGRQVVRGGEVLTIDIAQAIAGLQAAQDATLATTASRDWAKRGIDQMSPRVYAVRDRI
ncbi:MAG: amidohydrolase family protein [Alphaproteobacteria bacterium]|nr:amidohydrolase family protein [Alphaproteobacteria bacterium]